MRRTTAHGLALVLSVVSLGAAQGPNSSGSGKKQEQQKSNPAPAVIQAKKPKAVKPKAYQVGTASWYGKDFQGKVTASGEPFNMYDLTAAHMKLPLGTWVKVTNLRNNKAVVVRINDRGPVVPGRIIDLSYGAARALQLKAYGIQRVRLDVVEPETVAEIRPVAY